MNGPILPSGILESMKESDMNYFQKLTNDVTLKVGVVVDIYDNDDKDNNKFSLGPEYRVMTVNKENIVMYDNCRVVDGFGSVADFQEVKYRKVKNKEGVQANGDLNRVIKDNKEVDKVKGSIVIILCLGGDSESAIIIGSLPNTNRKVKLSSDKEHHMEGEFNGIRYSIDKNGALSVTFKSATDLDGKPKDSINAGSQWKIEEDGSTEFNTAPLSNELKAGNLSDAEIEEGQEDTSEGIKYEKIRIDRPNKKIILEARQDIDITSDKSLNITTKENIKANITKDLIVLAEGKANIEAKSGIEMKSDSDIKASVANLKINLKNAAQVKGQTADFIFQQLQLTGNGGITLTSGTQAIINAPLISLGPAPLPAVVMTTQFIGVGNLGVPVVSTAIGPFSTSTFISS